MKQTFMMNFSYRDWHTVSTEDNGKTFKYYSSVYMIDRVLKEGYLYERVYKYYKENFR